MDPLEVASEIEAALAAASKALRTATRDALRDAGQIARAELDKRATLGPGPDRRFSRSGRPANRVKVRIDRDGGARVSPVGAWGLAESGAPAHPQRRGQHPGTERTQGRGTWTAGRDAAFARITRQLPDQVGTVVEEAFTHGR